MTLQKVVENLVGEMDEVMEALDKVASSTQMAVLEAAHEEGGYTGEIVKGWMDLDTMVDDMADDFAMFVEIVSKMKRNLEAKNE